MRGATLTRVATREPSAARSVVTVTGPAWVRRCSRPVPCRSAWATAVAIVAWPQNGTSASGLKYRTSRGPSSESTTNAVSE